MELTSQNRKLSRASLTLTGMDCSDCELVLEHRLSRLDGVMDVEADYVAQTIQVNFDPMRISRRVIVQRIRQMGYEPSAGKLASWLERESELLLSLLSGFLLLLGWLGEVSGLMSAEAAHRFYVASYLPGGYLLIFALARSLRQHHLDTDFLMLAAALGAASIGQFAEGGALIFLFSLGHSLQERALDRARNAIRALGNLSPRVAVVLRRGGEQDVPIEILDLGDIVIVRPGERIPVDGEIVSGFSNVNEAHLTGEPLPIEKKPSEQVKAGSLNLDGSLEVRVSRLARDSTLARVIKLVETAQDARSPSQLWVERFTRIYVPMILLIFLGMLVVPIFSGEPTEKAFMRAIVFLVAASPCALALGTPSALIAGIAQAARHGVMVKGGIFLENLGRLKVVAFDKTGTLTTGKPHVTDILSVHGYTSKQILILAASVEKRSPHPLAQAITRYADEEGLETIPARNIESLTGHGLRAEVDGSQVWMGSLSLQRDLNMRLPDELMERTQELQAQGKTLVFVGIDLRVVGLIAVADNVRQEARSVLSELAELGVHETVMLSGDHPRSVSSIADQIGMEKFEAGLMPEDKLGIVQKLVEEHRFVGMVGDGVNDAPALARATVGIAIGSAQNDIAFEAADVTLMADDLCQLPFAIGLGKAVRRVTIQNFLLSIGSILVLVGITFWGRLNISPAVFLHESVTLLVIVNALRLLRYNRSCQA